MNIPLEDSFTDIIGKAQRGHGLADSELAKRAHVSLDQLMELKSGSVDESVLRRIAANLSLSSDALLALALGSYIPAPVHEIEGLAQINTPFEDMTVNSYVVWDPVTLEAAFFDTGSDGQPMLDLAQKRGLHVRQIFLTHTHGDHILDLDRLKEKTGAKAFICELEPLDGAESFVPDTPFKIGNLNVQTLLTSGHAAGGITFFIRGLAKPVAIVGDSIFAGSMGGGMFSYADALQNNRDRVLTLPEETVLCPGHGPLTTVGEQKRTNPFFAT